MEESSLPNPNQPLQNLLIPINNNVIHSNLNVFFSEEEMLEKLKVNRGANSITCEVNPQSDGSEEQNNTSNQGSQLINRLLKQPNGIFKRKTVHLNCTTINTQTKNSGSPRIFRVIELKLGKQTILLQDNFTFVSPTQSQILETNFKSQYLPPKKRSNTHAKYQILTRSVAKKRKYKSRKADNN